MNAADDGAAMAQALGMVLKLETGRSIKLVLGEHDLQVHAIEPPSRSWLEVVLCQAGEPALRLHPYLHVLNADAHLQGNDVHFDIRIVNLADRKSPEPIIAYRGIVQGTTASPAKQWTIDLMQRSYSGLGRQKRLRVVVNPAAGPGKAKAIWLQQVEPIFRAAGCSTEATYTEHKDHCKDIAHHLAIDKYDAFVVQSGDGLLYEAMNGFCTRQDALKILQRCPIGVIPSGSGNAISCSLNGPDLGNDVRMAALTVIKEDVAGQPMPLDVCSVTQNDRRSYSFISQAFGLMADVDLGTEHLRWMGSQRFVFGFIQRALAGPRYNCEIAMRIVESDKEAMKAHSISEAEAKVRLMRPEIGSKMIRNEQTAHSDAAAEAGDCMPPLRFGTVKDPLPASPDTSSVAGSRASGWTTINAPLANMYAGMSTYLSRDLCQFPIANCDGTVVVSILPIVGNLALLSFMDGAAEGKHYDQPKHEYYKVEAYRLTPRENKSRFPNFISIDGEHFPFEPYQVEVHSKIARILTLRQGWFLPEQWIKTSDNG